MGLVNTVVPLDKVEDETVAWCKDIMKHSPTALRFLKAAMNADTDGLAGLQQMAGDATLLYYTTDEAKEGRDAFKENAIPILINSLNSHKYIKRKIDLVNLAFLII